MESVEIDKRYVVKSRNEMERDEGSIHYIMGVASGDLLSRRNLGTSLLQRLQRQLLHPHQLLSPFWKLGMYCTLSMDRSILDCITSRTTP